ncbi:hypothetical protein [Brevibacillus sp. SAFN-007a]|uniref:hypothetical protein n=1 Tax=Brevibacillus sp. SAFN-007a TaxID=3436862 RepID=UPI003F7EE062
MRKIGSILIAILLTVSIGNVALAEDFGKAKEEVIFKANEINDLQVLFERAKAKKTDLKEVSSGVATIFKDGGPIEDIPVYQTTQKIQSVKDLKTNNIKESYVTYVFYNVPKEVLLEDSFTTYGQKGDEKWDSSYSVQAYSTYYFDRYYDQNNLAYKKLTSVSGGWNIDDSSVAITAREVWFGASGGSLQDNGTAGGSVIQESPHYKPTSNSFSYNAPTHWKPVADFASVVGVTTKASLKRNSSTWTLEFQNVN